MLTFLKNIFGGADASLLHTPIPYPKTMAEMVEFLVLLQAPGTAPESGKSGNLLRLTTTLSKDPYCLGYLTGMFDSLCHQWDVPAGERRLVIGSASTLLFRDLLNTCCDPRSASRIEDDAFNGALTLANDAAFLRGKFDGCSELTRYTATKRRDDMPVRLHERFKHLAALA